MTAKIGLQDVRFHAPHGFFEEEHRMGNEFSIDVEVLADVGGAAQGDDLGGTVNYATIYYLIQSEMKKPTQLLEALAYRIGGRIQQQFDGVSSVKVRLRKLNPPLGGKVAAAFVEIELGAGGGMSFGGPAPRQDTFEDPGGYDRQEGPFSGGGGGFSLSGGGISGFNRPAPPPVFAQDFGEDEDEEWQEEDEFFEDDPADFPEDELDELTPDEAALLEEGYDEGEFDDMDFGDDIDLSDFDFDRLRDLDPDDL